MKKRTFRVTAPGYVSWVTKEILYFYRGEDVTIHVKGSESGRQLEVTIERILETEFDLVQQELRHIRYVQDVVVA